MTALDPSVLELDYAAEADRIAARLREIIAVASSSRSPAASTPPPAPRSRCARSARSACSA
jgi:hypothetical protein